eukprot:Phypoly_transcript_03120.p1 GENE.Phypoly_transcript_03120~~Phypoly_transcript_03120.p1  ORF type:complete len:769 (+),score=121.84 Phypoly_transcript_03120:162-2468(+)
MQLPSINVPVHSATSRPPSSSSRDGVVAFAPYSANSKAELMLESHRQLLNNKKEPFYAKFLSIRVVLVCITLFTVIALAIGLIILSVQAQDSIVSTLSAKITNQVEQEIIKNCSSLFDWAQTEIETARLMFDLQTNINQPSAGLNPFITYPEISEYLWSIIRKKPVGIEAEFDFLDGRMMGFESFNYSSDIYWVDWVNNSLYEVGWAADLDNSIASINMSADNHLYEFPLDYSYEWINDTSRTFLQNCSSPPIWFDLWLYMGSIANYYIISDTITICDSEGDMVGFLSVSLGLSSIVDMLHSITQDIQGKIFIMDSQQQLVASSTNSDIFTIYENYTYSRNTILDNNEKWIQDVVELLHGNYDTQRQSVHVNGTNYYLSIVHWHAFSGIDWSFVMLLEQGQFLGNSHMFFVKCLIAAALVSAAAVTVVSVVTWATTKPLFILANDLQKMSHLDLEVTDMETPRLFELGKLYRSVTSMYVALRSFRKYVPIQVVSNIIKSEKEARAELTQSKITIMFQDIEGFTGLAETLDPVTLAKLTSEYMETMTEIVVKHGGTIDKYIGDCIMSLFGAPEPLPNHPLAAAKAATECMKALERKNIDWKSKYGVQMQCRIGINTGNVLIGNMGSDHRMNYTAFGDAVNVASRLEGVNKYFGTRIIVSKAVSTSFQQGQFITRKLAKVRVSGKAQPTSIFEIRATAAAGTAELFRSYERALKLFKKQDFSQALESIRFALVFDEKDVATNKLRERIETAMNLSPLPATWTYVEDLISK